MSPHVRRRGLELGLIPLDGDQYSIFANIGTKDISENPNESVTERSHLNLEPMGSAKSGEK